MCQVGGCEAFQQEKTGAWRCCASLNAAGCPWRSSAGDGKWATAPWRRSVRRGTAAFVEVEALESVTPPAGRSTGSLGAELMLPGGAVLRVYQINPTGGQA